MKKIIFIILIIIAATACQKEYQDQKVRYMVLQKNNLTQPFTVSYLDETGATITETIDNSETAWEYSWDGKPGDLLYMHMRYHENLGNNPNMNSVFRVMIKVDNEIFKEAYNFDRLEIANGTDSTYVIHLSGTIPYNK